MKRNFILITLIYLGLSTCQAFGQDFSGKWEGILTQEEGGFSPSYDLFLVLHQEGKRITGTSTVVIGNIYVEMEVKGIVINDFYMVIKDIKILRSHKAAGMEWCYKTYSAIINTPGNRGSVLEGSWSGKTSFSACIPGKIRLTRYIPRA